MAETSGKAFGRYLRTLRERRGLSLDEVRSLSQTFPETLTKSYLSRCEHGHHKVALAKLIPLSRIYEVPAEALLERIELDLELDRLGGPDTEGKSFAELADAAKEMSERGFRWEAYACTRDALARSGVDPVRERYRDAAEQVAIATLNVATIAGGLGRYRLALHESTYVAERCSLSAISHARVCERIAAIYDLLHQVDLAEQYADEAIASAEASGDRSGLAHMLLTRGLVATRRSDDRLAVAMYHRSYQLNKELGNRRDTALVLVNLAETYLKHRRLGAARRACDVALGLLKEDTPCRQRSLALATLGEIEDARGQSVLAIELWQQALALAKALRDRVLRFKVEVLLLRRALSDGNRPGARAIQRRLRRLSPWIPRELDELAEFRKLLSESPPAEIVAGVQREELPGCN